MKGLENSLKRIVALSNIKGNQAKKLADSFKNTNPFEGEESDPFMAKESIEPYNNPHEEAIRDNIHNKIEQLDTLRQNKASEDEQLNYSSDEGNPNLQTTPLINRHNNATTYFNSKIESLVNEIDLTESIKADVSKSHRSTINLKDLPANQALSMSDTDRATSEIYTTDKHTIEIKPDQEKQSSIPKIQNKGESQVALKIL